MNLLPTSIDVGSMSVQQIADRLEHQRINELKNAALDMKGTLVQTGRCPKCTLKPPCKHYDRVDDLPSPGEATQSTQKKQSPQKEGAFGQLFQGQVQIIPKLNQAAESEGSKYTTTSSTNTGGGIGNNLTLQNSGAQILQSMSV